MKTSYLLPHSFKKFGWLIFLPTFAFAIYWLIFGQKEPEFLDWEVFALFSDGILSNDEKSAFGFIENNWLGELIGIGLILGGILVAFSKEKQEDEFIAKIRLESLVWATYVNYIVLFLALILIYDFNFLLVMEINLFTILIFFIIRFRWMLNRAKKIN